MKKQFIVSLAFSLLLSFALNAQSRVHELEKMLEDKYQVAYHNIKLGDDGKYYVTGFFEDSLNIGGRTIHSRGLTDVFFARFDHDLNLDWIKLAGGNHVDIVKLLHTDVHKNIYVSGLFRGLVYFEDTIIQSPGRYNYFTAKYNDKGDLLWIRQNTLK